MAKRIFITVAEVSGDQNAALLAAALREIDPSIQLEGLGGPKMAAAGVRIHFETTARAAMTFHALARAREVWRWLAWMKQQYARAKPDLHICVDSSGFNLHFAKVAKSFGVPVLYYVAPQLWASREGRIKKVRAFVDRVASIFPFEAAWYRERGVNAEFVGHPLFDLLPADRLERGARPPRYPDRAPVIGVVPGSRKSEVRENWPSLLEVMERIAQRFPGAEFLVPATKNGLPALLGREGAAAGNIPTAYHLSETFGVAGKHLEHPIKYTIEVDAFDRLIPQCDLCITKSGTSTVHVAAYGVPMIVVYRLNPLLWHGAGRWLIKTKKIAMVNILAGQIEAVPEFIPWYGPVDEVANCAIDLLSHPEKLTGQRQRLVEIIEPISRPGASMNVAKMAMAMMNKDRI
jgi:lipid-A-disaccharide synthase